MKQFVKAMNGRFGRKRLLNPYRTIWMCMTWGTLAFLVIRFVIWPFLTWWEGVVSMLNYVIWGI